MRWRGINSLLIVGGHVQLILTLVGATGISGAAALGIAKAMTPSTFWEYVFVGFAFMATLPVSFPLAAYVMNLALAKVEQGRKRNLFDDPVETARKKIDGHIIDGRDRSSQLPSGVPTSGATLTYHAQRMAHWVYDVDADLSRSAGPYAAKWFTANDEEEPWRTTPPPLSYERLRHDMDRYVNRLQTMRDSLPIDRQKWLRLSLGLDIASGRKLCAFLNASGVNRGSETFGSAEVTKWIIGIRHTLGEDAPEYAHLFNQEGSAALTTPKQRREYVEGRLADLDQLWRSL